MERWERQQHRRGRDNPSFSSTLLDSIYRSIDETDGETREQHKGGAPDPLRFRDPPRKKQTTEKSKPVAVSEKPVTRRKLESRDRRFFTSTSSSSDCSSFGGFSSSEADSVIYNPIPPIRTGGFSDRSEKTRSDPPPPQKKTSSIKSRFRDLRKVKSPVSPGARLASFLNTLFASAGNAKKAKIVGGAVTAGEQTCSSASSYSRSCLSKTPSSAATKGAKRTVRFYPVSIIVGEDCRPCGQKCLYDGGDLVAPPWTAAESKKRVEKMMRGFEEEEEDDDGASDSSSDLFELENLTAIGRYRDELPVYETTHLGVNRAIAQGLIM